MTAMPSNTDPDRFEPLEMDGFNGDIARRDHSADNTPDDAAERMSLLEIDAPTEPSRVAPILQEDITPEYDSEFGAPASADEPVSQVAGEELLGDIAAQSARNAAAGPSGAFGSVRRVTAENAVISEGQTGREHRDSGASLGIFARPAAERRFIVGPNAQQIENQVIRPGELVAGQVVAGAAAEGHGVLVGWRGDRQITRAVLLEALRAIGREEWAPKPKDARAQAGRAMSAAGSSYHVKADRKGAVTTREGSAVSGQHRWRIGQIDMMGSPGDHYGMTVAIMTLSPEGALTCAGDLGIGQRIIDDYTSRCAQELYTSADLTAWLTMILQSHCAAISYGRSDLYVPAKHRDSAIALCQAVSDTGWGCDWLGSKDRPAVPLATGEQLRTGIATGLKDEVAQVLARLHAEREAAKLNKITRRAAAESIAGQAGIEARQAADTLLGDIGPTRAGSFLRDLKAIASRVVAYGELLGEDRMGNARRAVHEAVCELEGLLDSENSGISQRFGLIFEELAEEAKRKGDLL